MAERGLREAGDSKLQSTCLQLQEAVDEAQKWRIQQYNELVHELSKISESLAQEAKTRQSKDDALSAEVNRLREETVEEANSRKQAVSGLAAQVKDVLLRIERDREAWTAEEKKQNQTIAALRDECIAEASRRETSDGQLRQLVEREMITREEAIEGAARAWQRANAKTNEEWHAAVRSETGAREEAQLRLEQQLVDLKTALAEVKAIGEQREVETAQRFMAAADALAVEEA